MPMLQGKNIVITGGTALWVWPWCGRWSEGGAHCHVPAIETAVPGDRFPKSGVSVTTYVDLSDEVSVAAFYAKLPPLGGVVNIAGGFAWAPIADSSLKVMQQQMAMNYFSCALSCREAVASFRKGRQGGKIVNISARPALNPRQGASMTAYTSSKAAVAAFTVALAEELKGENISVIALAPSTIDTPANRKEMPEADHASWVKPTSIAELIVTHMALSDPVNSGALIPIYGKA